MRAGAHHDSVSNGVAQRRGGLADMAHVQRNIGRQPACNRRDLGDALGVASRERKMHRPRDHFVAEPLCLRAQRGGTRELDAVAMHRRLQFHHHRIACTDAVQLLQVVRCRHGEHGIASDCVADCGIDADADGGEHERSHRIRHVAQLVHAPDRHVARDCGSVRHQRRAPESVAVALHHGHHVAEREHSATNMVAPRLFVDAQAQRHAV